LNRSTAKDGKLFFLMGNNCPPKELKFKAAPKSQMPHNVQPMLCRMVKEPFDRAG
jgi:hypothetical protein